MLASSVRQHSMKSNFDHEKLHVYQQAIEFLAWCEEILQKAPKKMAVYEQLDRASTSIALNIAEGNGKFSNRDRCRFLDIARASALESAACLDVLVAKGHFKRDDLALGKTQLNAIVSMLMRLIATVSNRVSEEGAEYNSHQDLKDHIELEQEHEQE